MEGKPHKIRFSHTVSIQFLSYSFSCQGVHFTHVLPLPGMFPHGLDRFQVSAYMSLPWGNLWLPLTENAVCGHRRDH